jgi:hypothetical protein
LLLTFAAFALFTYTSIWLQSIIGLTPIKAGLIGLPLTFSSFTVSAAIGRHLVNLRPGPVIASGLALIGAGDLVGAALVHGSAGWPALLPGLFLSGIGVGMATPTLSSAGMAAVPMQRGGMAAGAVNTARQLGFAFGIALLGTAFSMRVESALSSRHVPQAASVAHAVSGGQAARILAKTPSAARHADDAAFHHAGVTGVQTTLLVAGLVGLIAGALTYVLVRSPAPMPHGAAEPAAAAAAAQS